ncbi:MAG: hypothetical protein EOP84_29940 [Verrucomicrobiaceae bacterium]|nr:MAG: hypothetical protein EOP84_29940 [Verrucomicrobiaceae bacterium]
MNSVPAINEAPKVRADLLRSKPAMRDLVRILLFFALLVAIVYIADQFISAGLRRIPTSKFGALNAVMKGGVDADVLVSGSSRALNHYDPRVISAETGLAVYNMGMNATQIDTQLAMLRIYLSRNRKPRLVIQNLDLFSFITTRKHEIYDPGLFIAHLRDPLLYHGLRRIDPAVVKWKHLPLYGYSVEDMRFTWMWGALAWVNVFPREDYFSGYNPRYTAWTEDFAHFRRSNPNGVLYRIEPAGVQALTELVELCGSHGVPLVFVYSPEYIEMQQLERNREELFAEFHRIAAHGGIDLLDFSNSPLSLDRRNFYNSQHLNALGAEKFSRELSGRLNEWLKR